MVRHGRIYPCAYAAYAGVLGERFGIAGLQAGEADSISFHGEASGREIMDFLLRPVPWCQHCDYDAFTMYPWERSHRELDEWVTRPTTSACANAPERPATR